MFFFHFDESPAGNAAASAFKLAVKEQGLNYDQAATRLGVTKSVLAKFVGGRPPSGRLLKKLTDYFPEPHSRRILAGYLKDELARIGVNGADKIVFVQKTRHTYLIEQIAQLVGDDGNRAVDLVKLIEGWQTTGTPSAIPSQKSPSRVLPD